MDPSRIAEIRRRIFEEAEDGNFYVEELLDALLASQEEVTRLKHLPWVEKIEETRRLADFHTQRIVQLAAERDRLAEENTRLREENDRFGYVIQNGLEEKEARWRWVGQARDARIENERLASQVAELTTMLATAADWFDRGDFDEADQYARFCVDRKKWRARLTPTDPSFAEYVAEQSPDVLARRSEEADRLLGLTPTAGTSSPIGELGSSGYFKVIPKDKGLTPTEEPTPSVCATCGGTGKIKSGQALIRNNEYYPISGACPDCVTPTEEPGHEDSMEPPDVRATFPVGETNFTWKEWVEPTEEPS